jgi:plastocyanin
MRKLSLPVLAVVAAISLAACGSSDNSSGNSSGTTTGSASTGGASTQASGGASGGRAGTTLQLAADASALKFDTTSLSAKAGKVTIDFNNPSAIGHDVTIEAAGDKEIAKTPVISQSHATLSATLKPGTYKFYCSVPGHEAAGMKGTLTVK